jgi:hypothetical protein
MTNLSSMVFCDSTKMNHPNCDIEDSSLLDCNNPEEEVLSIYIVSDKTSCSVDRASPYNCGDIYIYTRWFKYDRD